MATDLKEAIQMLVQERGIPEELVQKTIEDFLLAAYKKRFGTAENAHVEFSEDGTEVTLYAKKQVVADEDFEDEVLQIPLSEARKLAPEAEPGDELLMEVDPKSFDRGAVQVAKQRAQQELKEIQRDTLYSEFKDKVGELIIGYYQRERNGNIYVDLGKIEGILPRKYQSPREVYRPNDRIKALIYEVNKTPSGLQVILSRTHTEFVRKILELEVPEIYDKTVEIFKIVREPGYRTKIAVYSRKEGVDPVGACVGVKGVRIQALVNELEGERVDVIRYDPDPVAFIKNSLSPAEVEQVIILDRNKKHALAVVKDNQLSLAIGKQGLNVRLANRLVDWNIDVKTAKQVEEMGIGKEAMEAVSAVFSDLDEQVEEITRIEELPGLPPHIVEILSRQGYEEIEDLVFAYQDNGLEHIPELTEEDRQLIGKILEDAVEIVEEEETAQGMTEEGEEEYVETYLCPECSAEVTPGMDRCPQCGVELVFTDEEEEN
ncbi:NusA antitermination factor [Spirochaeta thermophila DSM 6578]|uniref:Transcription termination/antitermination protein NusA n=1 Tax=Winmispira thermophila (strain ATCC 700085 / DSM 6578 / Z-1203) TaxID=869211 RepID=G0GE67_WINT7|nr:transcription termination factor NusA [Spirochaeta thermophila]AEJ61420.1 NusA antitermination factor [Spirochaeta thermophila DSM 6578]